jgi:hypothetical protein
LLQVLLAARTLLPAALKQVRADKSKALGDTGARHLLPVHGGGNDMQRICYRVI